MLKSFSENFLYKNKSSFILLILLGSFIFGCTTSQFKKTVSIEQQITDGWLVNKAILEKIQQFEIQGKMKFTSAEQRISANFIWKQSQNNLSLRLTNFLGSTLLKLDSSPAGATIINHRGKKYSGKNLSQLVNSLTRVTLPVAELGNWLKALPNKENGYQLNNLHTLASLSEYRPPNHTGGWQITYQNYGKFNDVLLPKQISMNNQKQEINLLITRWNL